VNACAVGSDAKSLHQFETAKDADDMADAACSHACKPTTLLIPGRHKFRITLVPQPLGLACNDPLRAVDIAKAADVVLMCMPVATTSKGAGQVLGAEGVVDAKTRLFLQVWSDSSAQCDSQLRHSALLALHVRLQLGLL
jgi:hypothetical protein